MASKDDRPGLLSKVAMFVRNPTKDWSELDQSDEGDSSGYDKNALKAMIERKRQNDFVRKREFDQLRKLRNRDPGALAGMGRPSFFQNSLPTDLDGRAVTLKKIDEIEAQMSRQWWKGKSEGATQPYTLPATPESTPASPDTSVQMPAKNHENLTVSFASTLPYDMQPAAASADADEFQPTQMASVPAPDRLEDHAPRSDAAPGFAASRPFAPEVDEMATDPELEEAAIRFANSDDGGAESGLLAALRGNDLAPQAAQSWAAALLDLYRATNRRMAFEVACEEFAVHLDGVRPLWAALGGTADSADRGSASGLPGPLWRSPANLGATDMEALRECMLSRPMPWHLDWSALERIASDAFALLQDLLASLCAEEVQLRLDGTDRLLDALRALTPSDERNVDPVCWEMRLGALRILGLQDDFEIAALDYCVALGVSPPAWAPARCRLQSAAPSLTTPETGLADTDAAGVLELALRGEVLGDGTGALAALDASPSDAKRIWIACGDLVRVDFAAAGSILNWVAMRQAEGQRVQFQNVHRLVAAFFNVIGINEHAKVIPRPI